MIRLITILLLCLGLPLSTAGATEASSQEFRLFYSSDVHGETEPCG